MQSDFWCGDTSAGRREDSLFLCQKNKSLLSSPAPLPLTPSSGEAAGVRERAWEQQDSDPRVSKQSFVIMQRLDRAAEDLEIREAQCELNQIIITRVSKILML